MNGLLNASTDTMFAFLSPKLSPESGDGRASQIPTELLASREGGELGIPNPDIPQNAFSDLLEGIIPPVPEDVKLIANQDVQPQTILFTEESVQNLPLIVGETQGTSRQQLAPQATVKYAGIKRSPEAELALPSPEQLSPQEAIKYAGIKPSPDADLFALATNVTTSTRLTPFTEPPAIHALADTPNSRLPDEIKIEHLQISIADYTIADYAIVDERKGTEKGQLSQTINADTTPPETDAAQTLVYAGIKTPFPTNISNEASQQEIPAQFFAHADIQVTDDVLVPSNLAEPKTQIKMPIDKVLDRSNIVTSGGLVNTIETDKSPIKAETLKAKTLQPLTTNDDILVGNLPQKHVTLPANVAQSMQTDTQNTDTIKSQQNVEANPLPSFEFTNTNSHDGQEKNPAPHQTKQHQTPIAQPTPSGAVDTASFSLNTTVEVPQISLEAKAIETLTSSSLSTAKSIAPPMPAQISHIAVQQVGEAIVRQAEKSGDIVIRLDPAELGKVNITFTFDKVGGVNAHVVADTASTAALLRDRADVLTTQLKQSGFENINLSFDTNTNEQSNKGFGTQFSNQSQSETATNRAKFFDIVEQDIQNPLEQIEPQQRPTLTDGALDLKL